MLNPLLGKKISIIVIYGYHQFDPDSFLSGQGKPNI